MPHVFRHYVSFGFDAVCKVEKLQRAAEQDMTQSFDMGQYFTSKALQTEPFANLSANDRDVLCGALTSLQSNRGKRESVREHSHTAMAVSMVYFFIYKGLIGEEFVQEPDRYIRFG